LRSPRILRSHRGPVAAVLVVLLVALALADRLGLFGWRGDDRNRYHHQSFVVVNVVDGDTLDVDAPDGSRPTTRVRLWGVDTPEVAGSGGPEMHFGPQASGFTKSLVLDQRIRLELSGQRTRDRYGRLLAFVYLADGGMLNEQLVETGHAYADPRFDHEYKQRFSALEERARRGRTGLWTDVSAKEMPLWRQRLEARKVERDR
jgi:micrococcal nuclease